MKLKKLIPFGKAIAAAIIILGIIHDVATYTPIIKGGLSCLTPEKLKAMIYMSLMCGTSLILSGLLLIILLNKVKEFPFLVTPILVIGSFLAIVGYFSIFYMSHNPFAWIAVFLNLTMFGVTVVLGINIKNNRNE